MTTSPARERRRETTIVTLEPSTAETPGTSPTTTHQPRPSRTSTSAGRASATSATTDAERTRPNGGSHRRRAGASPNRGTEGSSALGRLVDEPTTFARTVWGRVPVLHRGADTFGDLLSLDEI